MSNVTAGLSQAELDRNLHDQLGVLDDVYLRCRELRHAWEERGLTPSARRGSRVIEFTEVVECIRCGTIRHDLLHAGSWELVGRRYEYPDGYRMSNAGFVHVVDIRGEKFRRHAPSLNGQ